MQERLFSEAELREMEKRTVDRLVEAIDAGDADKAKQIAKRMYNEFLSMHDLYRNWTTAMLSEIGRRFGYALSPPDEPGRFYKPTLEPHPITGAFTVAGVTLVPFAQDHGFSTTLGFRIGKFAYSTDVTELDETAFATLQGVEVWVVDCMRRAPHPTHSHLDKTLGWIERVRPRRAILTHMDHTLDYRSLAAELPAGVEPGYDGLAIQLSD